MSHTISSLIRSAPLVAAALASGTTAAAGAATIFSDSFEAQTVGSRVDDVAPTVPGAPWTASFDNGTTIKFRVAADADNYLNRGPTNKVLNVLDTLASAGGNTTATDIAGATTVSTFSFDFYEPSRETVTTPSPLAFQIGAGAVNNGNGTVLFSYTLNDGAAGGTAGAANVGAYSLDAPHTLVLVANNSAAEVTYTTAAGTETLPSRRFDVYIDGVLASDDRAANSGTTPAVGTPLSAFNFQSYNAAANQQVFVDDVLVVDAAPGVVPEPASSALLGLAAAAACRRPARRRLAAAGRRSRSVNP